MSQIQEQCEKAYAKHKHLKLAAQEVGIPWQTVYVHLRNAGVPVTGDKLRYGSETDRLAAKAEQAFKQLVPFAEDQNESQFQAKIDFVIRGYGVDVKASRLKQSHKLAKTSRWSFSLKKQERNADFFVCLAFDDAELRHCLLIPGEIARHYSTMSLSSATKGKWWDYEVQPADLAPFFASLPEKG